MATSATGRNDGLRLKPNKQLLDAESSSDSSAYPLGISNNTSNANDIFGTVGTLINYNQVTNHIVYGQASKEWVGSIDAA